MAWKSLPQGIWITLRPVDQASGEGVRVGFGLDCGLSISLSLPSSCSHQEMLSVGETQQSQPGALGRVNSQAHGPWFWVLEGLRASGLSSCWALARLPTRRKQDAQPRLGLPKRVADVPTLLWAEVRGSARSGLTEQDCRKDRLARAHVG